MRTDETAFPIPALDLSALTFEAKIDYVTFYTPDSVERLPGFAAAAQSATCNSSGVRVTNPSKDNLSDLARQWGDPRIADLAISIEISRPEVWEKPFNCFIEALSVHLLDRGLTFSQIHKDLRIRTRSDGSNALEALAARHFTRCLPPAPPFDLHGDRSHSVELRGSGISLGRGLISPQPVLRMAVRISDPGLSWFRVSKISDLSGFRYRRMLMPYFTHVKGVRVRRAAAQRNLLDVLNRKQQEFAQADWDRLGVHAFLPGGAKAGLDVEFLRDGALNGRIGQALYQLERRLQTRARKLPSGSQS